MIPPTEASDINYTPIDILPSSGMTTGITSASASVIANSPPSTSTHYTTILAGIKTTSVSRAALKIQTSKFYAKKPEDVYKTTRARVCVCLI